MQIIDQGGASPVDMSGIITKANEKKKELEQIKSRLFQKIIVDWDQSGSLIFWNQCFELVPFDAIKRTVDFIKMIRKEGYPLRNPAAFFVHQLKKLGYYPFKEENSGSKQED